MVGICSTVRKQAKRTWDIIAETTPDKNKYDRYLLASQNISWWMIGEMGGWINFFNSYCVFFLFLEFITKLEHFVKNKIQEISL